MRSLSGLKISLALSVVLFGSRFVQGGELTALDRYVAAADPSYEYHLVNTVAGEGFTTFILEMTSQTWLTTNEVDRPTWKHWLTVTRPNEVLSSTGFVFIGGGGNDKPAPKQADANLARIAVATKSVVTELRQVPNQPLVFAGDGTKRSEDSLIAYTWDRHLRTGDDRWPARLPMTKSAVRAMDTVTAFCASEAGGRHRVDRFMVAGGSKRGWTTWTTAAVDKRVVAIAPIVIDMLNIEPSFTHHWEVYGFYAPAVKDYEEMGIMAWQGSQEYQRLMRIVEPYSYRERFTMPKFILNATGDQFFLPDSSQFYFDDLPGVKYLRYVPNADHSLKDTDAWETLAAAYTAIINQSPLPRFSWKIEAPDTIRVIAESKASRVRLWQAHNPNARDFRLETVGKIWEGADLKPEADGSYLGRVEKPDKGWRAFLVELTFPLEKSAAPFKLTTPVKVVPDTKPFKYELKKDAPGTRPSSK